MTNHEQLSIDLPDPGPGTSRKIHYRRFGKSGARPKVYFQAALHADEIPGMLVVHHLLELLIAASAQNRIDGEIIIVPVANPVGMTQRIQGKVCGRLNLNNGKNFNRYFPDIVDSLAARVKGKLVDDSHKNIDTVRQEMKVVVAELPSDTESNAQRRALMSLSVDADICIDLHCDMEAVLHMYSGHIHNELVNQLSAQMGCETLLLASESGGQPFDEANSEIWTRLAQLFPDHPITPSCMACTIELRGKTDVSDELARHDAANLFQFLVNRGIIQGVKSATPKARCVAHPLEGVAHPTAPVSGVIVYKKTVGESIKAGETMAVIVEPFETGCSARHEVISEIDGFIYARGCERLVVAGQIISSISGTQPIQGRVGRDLLTD